jgi:hypothetical protein
VFELHLQGPSPVNGYLIKVGESVYVATTLKGYSYSDVSVDQVLKQIFEAEQA